MQRLVIKYYFFKNQEVTIQMRINKINEIIKKNYKIIISIYCHLVR